MEVNTDTDYFPSTSSGHRLTDALGSAVRDQLTSPTGNITYARAYDPYGVVTSTAGTAQTSYGYTGEFTSNEMVYLRARYYTPGIGRFLTRDPAKATNNLYEYSYSSPTNYTDPSGLFSKRDVANALWYGGTPYDSGYYGSFDLFLDNAENTARQGAANPKWGFIAALLDAEVGDRLQSYRAAIWGDPSNGLYGTNIFAPPVLVKASDSILKNNRPDLYFLYMEQIARGEKPYIDARYYVLSSQNGGIKKYVDGSYYTSYPDFKIATLNVVDSIKEAVTHFGAKLGKLGCLSYTSAKIVDRYGQVYKVNTLNIGISFSLATAGEGWVSQNPLHSGYYIPDEAILRSKIEGFSLGGTLSLAYGGSYSYSPSSGSGAGVISGGIQAGVSFDPTWIEYEYTDRRLGWDWLNQWESGAYGSPPTIFRSTLSTWSP